MRHHVPDLCLVHIFRRLTYLPPPASNLDDRMQKREMDRDGRLFVCCGQDQGSRVSSTTLCIYRPDPSCILQEHAGTICIYNLRKLLRLYDSHLILEGSVVTFDIFRHFRLFHCTSMQRQLRSMEGSGAPCAIPLPAHNITYSNDVMGLLALRTQNS